jgi:ferredoxin
MSRSDKRAIRIKVHDMLDKHCAECQVKTEQQLGPHEFEVYCIDKCPIGAQLQALGRCLDKEKPRKWFRWDKQSEELVLQMKKEGKSYREIAKALGAGTHECIRQRYHKLKKQGVVV